MVGLRRDDSWRILHNYNFFDLLEIQSKMWKTCIKTQENEQKNYLNGTKKDSRNIKATLNVNLISNNNKEKWEKWFNLEVICGIIKRKSKLVFFSERVKRDRKRKKKRRE